MLALIPIGLLLSVAVLWVFKRTSNQKAIQAAKQRMQACLYEMRLFPDEPSLVWKAQIALLAANARYIVLMLVPALIVALPMVIVFAYLEGWYGLAPLPIGREALVTMQMREPLDVGAPPRLIAPSQIAVESPPVRVFRDRQVSWRIRPAAPLCGVLRFALDGGVAEKTIVAGAGSHYVSERRVRGLVAFLLHPAEPRLPPGNIEWIEVGYPPVRLHWLGLDLHWLIWLLLFSTFSALLLKGRFHVTF